MNVAILVPVLARPGNVAPLLDAITATTTTPYRVLFICDPGDVAEHEAIAAAGGEMICPGGSYASKINAGVAATSEDLVLLGADDIRPHPGWLQAAVAAMVDGAQVVGLNDLIEREARPSHATHFLLTRAAAQLPCADGRRGPLCELYGHWYTDDELIATASARGMYAYAADAIVEHRHPMTGAAPDDATYRKGRASSRLDSKVFRRRCVLWT